MSADNVQLTEEEVKKVNEIISGIQSDLKKAIEAINNSDFDKALEFINNSAKRTNCTICQKKLNILKADIIHTKTICPLDTDLCEAEKDTVTDTATELKDEFVPMANTKKAIKDKKASLGLNEVTQKPLVPFPYPHEVLSKLFSRRV